MFVSESAEKAPAYRYAGAALFVAAAVILGALAFEYIGGYPPCPLCLQQRYAYYAGIPLLFLGMALAAEKPRLAALVFFAVALAFLANAGLGVYHAGAEWKLWPGPDTCGAAQALPTSATDLLAAAETAVVIRCDEAALRIAGLSLAGWNVIASLLAFALVLRAAYLAAFES
jgi:disulfide bond formation protein DsbB